MKKTTVITALVLAGAFALAGCVSDADQVSENLSKSAEQFEINRRIVVINAINGEELFLVEGRCSIETPAGILEVVCKHGPDEYKKHFIGLADNVTFITAQLDAADASEYHTRIILKPEALIPNFDLETKLEDGPGH